MEVNLPLRDRNDPHELGVGLRGVESEKERKRGREEEEEEVAAEGDDKSGKTCPQNALSSPERQTEEESDVPHKRPFF